MCENCIEFKYGGFIDEDDYTELMDITLDQIKAWYELPGNGAGGILHVLLDDMNCTDEDIRREADEISHAYDIVNNLQTMTAQQRANVIYERNNYDM